MALYEEFDPRPNRLIDAQSAYLRSAAYQPIGWYEFGEEAFAEALRQNKPIFLDIGALWCHWCHVIDRESYDDPEIATYLNELYIPIKVDRDERPDIDARYQLAVQFLTGQGGWPLTLFLTPEGKPFFGGTYFPPEDRNGLSGLKTLLPRAAEAFRQHRDELEEAAKVITERVARADVVSTKRAALSDAVYLLMLRDTRARFNVEQGGFEHGAPKFPHPGAIELALLQWNISEESDWRVIAERTLYAMGDGGIYDQLGGGFHRYSTDDSWTVPHFEKMSFDNALLLQNYVHTYRATGIDFFRRIAEGVWGYIARDLADQARGGFYGAQDADNSLQDDGSYWTWSLQEFTQALSKEEALVLTRHYGVRPEGNMPETERNVLRIAERPAHIAEALGLTLDEVEGRIAAGRRKLLQARLRRKTPQIDKNKYTGWNALLISAALEYGALLEQSEATETGLRALQTIIADAYDPDQGFYHNFHADSGARLPGFFEDQAAMAHALLDAFAVSGKGEYLQIAQRTLELCLAHYWDREHGGFFDLEQRRLAEEVSDFLRHPRKLIEDLPAPAPNALAAMALDRLWLFTHEERYHKAARQTLEAFAGQAPEYGPFAATYAQALCYHLHPPVAVIIIGHPEGEDTRRLHAAALTSYRPGRQVAVFSPKARDLPYPAAPDGSALAYICAGQTCASPTSDPEEVKQLLHTYGKPSLAAEE